MLLVNANNAYRGYEDLPKRCRASSATNTQSPRSSVAPQGQTTHQMLAEDTLTGTGQFPQLVEGTNSPPGVSLDQDVLLGRRGEHRALAKSAVWLQAELVTPIEPPMVVPTWLMIASAPASRLLRKVSRHKQL